MSKQYHIQLEEGDCAPYVLLPGDPGRVKTIAETWDKAEKMAENREYVSYRGEFKGVPISCTSTGIGASSTAIAVEELARVGAKVFLRIGTCGAFQPQIKDGDMVIFDSAARYDGASKAYAPIEFPAVANYEVVQACIEAAQKLKIMHHVGCTRTHDGLYARHPEPGSSFNNFWQSEWKEHYQDMQRLGIMAAEMEASIIMVLAKIWGLRAGGMAVSVINVLAPELSEEYDPGKDFDQSQENILKLASMGNEVMRILHQQNNQQ